jgi:hypothetical protein
MRGSPTDSVGEFSAELQAHLPDRFVGDRDAAGCQHLLDSAQAQWEAEIQPYHIADDFSGLAKAGVEWVARSGLRTDIRLPKLPPTKTPLNLTVPLAAGHRPKMRRVPAQVNGSTAHPTNTVGQPATITPPCAVTSPIRATGCPPTNTLEDPMAIESGGPTQTPRSATRAEGSPPISTVGQPGPAIGPPTCGTKPVTIGQVCISVRRAAGVPIKHSPERMNLAAQPSLRCGAG